MPGNIVSCSVAIYSSESDEKGDRATVRNYGEVARSINYTRSYRDEEGFLAKWPKKWINSPALACYGFVGLKRPCIGVQSS
jgi:hypothetical protein